MHGYIPNNSVLITSLIIIMKKHNVGSFHIWVDMERDYIIIFVPVIVLVTDHDKSSSIWKGVQETTNIFQISILWID